MNRCEICNTVEDRSVIDGSCEPCWERVTAYLVWKNCFPDDLAIGDMCTRMIQIDKAMQELEIPAEERNLLCRNMGWCVRTRPSFPTEPTLISELLKDAIQLRKAQDCIRKAKEDGTLVIDNEMD